MKDRFRLVGILFLVLGLSLMLVSCGDHENQAISDNEVVNQGNGEEIEVVIPETDEGVDMENEEDSEILVDSAVSSEADEPLDPVVLDSETAVANRLDELLS